MDSVRSTSYAASILVFVVLGLIPDSRAQFITASTRAETGAEETVVTFSVSRPEMFLVRVAGPTLASFGISGAYGDPSIELFRDGQLVAANNDWDDSEGAAIAAAAQSVSAFSFPSGSADSALLQYLPAGDYSLRVFGAQASQGVVLPEVFALSEGSFSSFFVRSRVSTLISNAVIVGGVLGTESYVHFEALGPSLGITGALADPHLAVYAQNSLLGENDNTPAGLDGSLVLLLNSGSFSAIGGKSGNIPDGTILTGFTAIPEPSSFSLSLVVLVGVIGLRRFRSKQWLR